MYLYLYLHLHVYLHVYLYFKALLIMLNPIRLIYLTKSTKLVD